MTERKRGRGPKRPKESGHYLCTVWMHRGGGKKGPKIAVSLNVMALKGTDFKLAFYITYYLQLKYVEI